MPPGQHLAHKEKPPRREGGALTFFSLRNRPFKNGGKLAARSGQGKRHYCGKANTYTMLPPLGWSRSGRICIGPLLKPPPAATAIYCRPAILKVTVAPNTCDPSRVCHN